MPENVPALRTDRRYFDILICVPLEVELESVYHVFPHLEDLTSNYLQRFSVTSGNADVSVIVVAQDEMGRSSARRCVAAALADYDVGLIVCLGIAGGLSSDLELGSVCYSGTVIDVYDNAKVTDSKTGTGTETTFAPTYLHTNRAVTSSLNFLRTNPTLSEQYRDWQAICADHATTMFGSAIASDPFASFELAPRSLNGTIACGQVSDSRKYNEKLKKIDRKILAVETESGGVFAAAEEHGNTNYITIRGISDPAENKGELEAATKGVLRRVAAYNAASFLNAQLKNPYFLKVLADLRPGRTTTVEVIPPAPADLASVVALLEEDIDGNLRERSPEYRLSERGYGLPVPRIRRADYDEALRNTGPEEIEDAISRVNSIVVDIPRSYPDDGLAWVIAYSLITSDIDRKQLLPYVIDGKLIGPPSNGFRSQKGDLLKFLDDAPDVATPVFLIDNPPLTSKTRMAYLLAECRKHPNAKFIFVVRGELDTAAATTLTDALNVQEFALCPISFEGIAHFVQKYCQLPPQESDVIALRLTETFERFGLLAHPTYFAGIPREALVALLQANKRAELIQLAVGGFLTLLVAGDTADVTLSRTTRERFLRSFVLETKVKGRKFTITKCVEFVAEFAALYDFDIEPIDFLQEFVQNGFLHYFQGEVYFSLPFIESYLLASELSQKPDLARDYFSIDRDDFDFASFDLYAEMGADTEVIERIIGKLNALKREWALTERNIVLSSDASPRVLAKPDTLARVKNRLAAAMRSVQENQDHTESKQRLIDLASQIRGTVSRMRTERSQDEDVNAIDDDAFFDITRNWVTGVILLGSGAEHLFATSKLALAEAIASVSSIIVDKWTRRNQLVDFDEIRAKLFDEVIASTMQFANEEEREQVRELFINVTDVLEHGHMAEPVRKVLGFLGEQARHKVLSSTLEKTATSETLEEVVRAAWLTDVDVSKGAAQLSNALKRGPIAPILRMSLASHLMAQVHWRHADKSTRLALLEAANDTIAPLSLTFDKEGQVRRDIEHGRLEGMRSPELKDDGVGHPKGG